jgi:hypothetical protein
MDAENLPDPGNIQGFTIRVTESLLNRLGDGFSRRSPMEGDVGVQVRTPRERQLVEQVQAIERRKRIELAKRVQSRLQQLEERRLLQAREAAERKLQELEQKDYAAPAPVGALPCSAERRALFRCYKENPNPLQCDLEVSAFEQCAKEVELQVLRRELGPQHAANVAAARSSASE